MEPEDSLIMGNEELSTIPEKESDEFIKSSVKDLVPIPSESEDTSESDSDCDLPSCDDFSPINVYEEKFVTFSNPLFDSNDDFTSSDDESLSDEDVPEENFKIYSNPLFEFDDEYISSDVNPLFGEVLENIESKDSYVSNLDERALLVTPLFDTNEDECFNPGGNIDEIELLLHRDPSTPKISIASILEGFTDEPPLEENDDLFDLESKENEWKKILYDASIDDLMTEDKVFDPGIHKKFFSPTYVRLPFEDRHYLSLTYVIRIFLPYFTYPVDSSLPLSSGSEDTIFDPGIPVFSLEPVIFLSGEITVHIEVLSVLWGNRLPIPDGSLPLSRIARGTAPKEKKKADIRVIDRISEDSDSQLNRSDCRPTMMTSTCIAAASTHSVSLERLVFRSKPTYSVSKNGATGNSKITSLGFEEMRGLVMLFRRDDLSD
ncbi:hypothetical protein Tco_0088064 [Tanacetum coccineum]